MRTRTSRCLTALAAAAAIALTSSGCDWSGPNSLPLPGTAGDGRDGFTVRIEMPNVMAIQRNSRVRVNDVTVGNVADIELDGWHAVVTVALDSDVELPANATAKIGQTSLLGSLHIELASPLGEQPQGKLTTGATIPLARASTYPTTEQTLASLSTVLNGGGLAQIQEITTEMNAGLTGHEPEVRDLLTRSESLVTTLNDQRGDIVTALEGLDRLAATVDQQNADLASALERIPPALRILADQQEDLRNTVLALGGFADSADRVVSESGRDLTHTLNDIEPVMRELADAGPDLPHALGLLPTYPWPLSNLAKFFRGDAGNLSATVDLTLGRIDRGLLQGTPFEGMLTNVETGMGRTVERIPAVSTKNPLTAGLESVVIRGER